MNSRTQYGLLLIFCTIVGVVGYNIWLLETALPQRPYSAFVADLAAGRISQVHLQGAAVRAEDKEGVRFTAVAPDIPTLLPLLHRAGVIIEVEEQRDIFDRLVRLVFPFLLLAGGWLIFARRRSTGTPWKDTRFTVRTGLRETRTFADVAGIDEVQAELMEIVDFLKNHEKYNLLGGRIPKGVLLQGPPGTGKTLLARAIAGEAGVPFFSMGGSDFVEVYAGVGASRVRELFDLAKKRAPCIVFIDEIDAIGGRRGRGSGSHEEREQTLNALLVEMDGFGTNETVIVIGATNRPDVLDPALLRPGRFDRQLTVSLPNLQGRIRILGVHTRSVRTSPAINLVAIAQGIPGFSGADIANLVNEAALIAARKMKAAVEMEDFEEAKDKIVMGLERKNAAINEKERRVIAYHEAGHAIVAKLLPETDQLHKITIVPRGMALGLTQQVPFEERYTYSLTYLHNRIKVLLGGRIAEKIVFNQLSTGSANDIEAASGLARRMVCEWGMSGVIGSTVHRHRQALKANGQEEALPSEATAREIDLEVRRIINHCQEETELLLRGNNRLIHELAEILLVNETIDAEELDIVMRCSSANATSAKQALTGVDHIRDHASTPTKETAR